MSNTQNPNLGGCLYWATGCIFSRAAFFGRPALFAGVGVAFIVIGATTLPKAKRGSSSFKADGSAAAQLPRRALKTRALP